MACVALTFCEVCTVQLKLSEMTGEIYCNVEDILQFFRRGSADPL